MIEKKIAVLGGGLSGLSIAYRLKKLGFNVVIFEKSPVFGGLANGKNYDSFVFDTGAHIFRTSDPKLFKFVSELTPIFHINYSAGMWKNNILQEASYPVLSQKSIDLLDPEIKKYAYENYQQAKKNSQLESTDEYSFQEVIRSQVGKTLCREYFELYAEKFWGLKASEISGEIAPKKLIMEEKGKWSHYTTSFKKAKNEIYPLSGGSNSFVSGLSQLCSKINVEVILNSSLSNIERKNDKILIHYSDNGKTKTDTFDFIFSTIPLTELSKLVSINTSLSYRSILIVDTKVNRSSVFDKAWVYFHDPDKMFIRATDMNNYGPNFSPKNQTGLMLEITCQQGDTVWNNSEIGKEALDQFLSTKLINRDEVEILGIRKIPYAYPLFKKGYKKELESFLKKLKNFGLVCVGGRTGAFKYLNMDGCMKYVNFDLNKIMKDGSISLEG